MIDIHTHILPGIDDGSKDVDMTKELLRMQLENGVNKVFLTPHFYPRKDDFDEFLTRRNNAARLLMESVGSDYTDIRMQLGGEIHYSPQLNDMDLEKLTLGNTDYMLLELSFHHYPAYIKQFIQEVTMRGITPILAHIERYDYFRDKLDLLYDLLEAGALAQVNMSSLLEKSDKGFSKAAISHGIATFVASDCHNPTKRPPNLGHLSEVLDEEEIARIEQYTNDVWYGRDVEPLSWTPIKKSLFGYK